MFEKPQYMTPGGYRRGSKNPSHREAHERALADKRKALQKKNSPGRNISPEAAKLIADAIRCMLREK